MEILNKRETKLYKELKNSVEKYGVFTISLNDMAKWNTLLKKIKKTEYINVVELATTVYVYKKESDFEQFEIEQKEASKEKRKISTHDYKVVIVSVVLTALIGILSKNIFTLFMTDSTDKYNEYCHEINRVIKDIDFEKGDISEGKIILYNDEKEVYNQIYDKFDSKYKIVYIRKDGRKVFFVLNASVDDEDGIVYLNGELGDVMDGLWSLERLGGDSYNYKTYK